MIHTSMRSSLGNWRHGLAGILLSLLLATGAFAQGTVPALPLPQPPSPITPSFPWQAANDCGRVLNNLGLDPGGSLEAYSFLRMNGDEWMQDSFQEHDAMMQEAAAYGAGGLAIGVAGGVVLLELGVLTGEALAGATALQTLYVGVLEKMPAIVGLIYGGNRNAGLGGEVLGTIGSTLSNFVSQCRNDGDPSNEREEEEDQRESGPSIDDPTWGGPGWGYGFPGEIPTPPGTVDVEEEAGDVVPPSCNVETGEGC